MVGRTPFEETDKEEFLTKEALEIYYQRTLTNTFFGKVDISPGKFKSKPLRSIQLSYNQSRI